MYTYNWHLYITCASSTK